ncbi:MAG: outer membrane beta-barrel protein [Candidatus Omnitrophota bacterium]|nr:outer membrane beta-barrel protein [Candidatus Omnitrophota bacterium]
MKRKMKRGLITLLAVYMASSFLAAGAGAEESIEEDTMLDIMPYLKIFKRTSVEFNITQQFQYMDNYYLSKTPRDGESRFGSVTSPSVSIKYPKGRSYLEGDYAYGLNYYIGDNIVNDQHAALKAYHRPTRRFSMGLAEDFIRSDQPNQQPDIDVKAGGGIFSRNTLRAEGKYEINRRLRCGATASYGFIDFTNEPADASANRNVFSGGGDIEYIIDPTAALAAVYNFNEALFTDTGKKDAREYSVSLRYSRRVTKAFNVIARGGYNFVSYRNGEDTNSASAGAILNFDISRFTGFTLSYDYGLENSSKKNYLAYMANTFRAGLKHSLTPRLILNVTSSYDIWFYAPEFNMDNTTAGLNKDSEVMTLECGLNYKLTKIIDLNATYNTSAKFSDFSDDQYFANIYTVSIRAMF